MCESIGLTKYDDISEIDRIVYVLLSLCVTSMLRASWYRIKEIFDLLFAFGTIFENLLVLPKCGLFAKSSYICYVAESNIWGFLCVVDFDLYNGECKQNT